MSQPILLVVEDDENLRLALADNLEQEGYAVHTAANAMQAQARMAQMGEQSRSFDLIVLDIMLPDRDGYNLCRDWRAQGVQAMIIALTARSLEEDIVRGFQAGADDYVVKPYRLREFLLRVKALLRRRARPAHELAVLPGYRIDRQAHKVLDQEGNEIALTGKEYALLLCLIDNRNSALTRDRILDCVWGQHVIVDERTVDNFVSNLKKKLKWHKNAGFSIATIRGVGYRMEIDEE